MATITPTLAGPSSHSYESTFAGKQIVVTGHTGFKGSWLSLWLSELGANVHGYGLAPNSSDSLFDCLDRGNIFASSELADLGDSDRVAKFIHRVKPDYVFHLAAQPLVRLSYAEPLNTIATNVLGSANVLDAVRTLEKTCHTIFVTSDKCYQNREWCYSYRENDPLGGKDPYSMSKAAAELVAESYRRSYFDKHPCGSLVISVRAGNVIGGGDYSADRLIPDCVRAALADRTLIIRNPRATRPWQHVLDCLNGYLHAACLAPELNNKADRESFNFGPCDPHDHPVVEVAQAFFEAWGESTPESRLCRKRSWQKRAICRSPSRKHSDCSAGNLYGLSKKPSCTPRSGMQLAIFATKTCSLTRADNWSSSFSPRLKWCIRRHEDHCNTH